MIAGWPLGPLLEQAGAPFEGYKDAAPNVQAFVSDRLAYLLEQRGFDVRNIRAVTHGDARRLSPLEARRKLEALHQMAGSAALQDVATLFKRVKNISKGVDAGSSAPGGGDRLVEPAEIALRDALTAHTPAIREATAERRLSAGVRHRGVAWTCGRALLRRCDGHG